MILKHPIVYLYLWLHSAYVANNYVHRLEQRLEFQGQIRKRRKLVASFASDKSLFKECCQFKNILYEGHASHQTCSEISNLSNVNNYFHSSIVQHGTERVTRVGPNGDFMFKRHIITNNCSM